MTCLSPGWQPHLKGHPKAKLEFFRDCRIRDLQVILGHDPRLWPPAV